MPSVVFLSGDLMFASRVRAAAQANDLEFVLATQMPTELSEIRFVILDLATRSKLTETLVEQCGQLCPEAKLIAFGPHVQVSRLDAARAAGIPTVMTRGQFDRELAGKLFH
ncbi:histidine kinase [Stieleria varia]|uniref:Uncharacterized protein n=1 Tax=Stieleria varia TaxID=2528005 RepID=A0A5C6AH65_9BACT|nr:histidine kinase [Stieleria varia]TWT98648.1 hypothetical protein Pla52n_51650 [Stieleria varia]